LIGTLEDGLVGFLNLGQLLPRGGAIFLSVDGVCLCFLCGDFKLYTTIVSVKIWKERIDARLTSSLAVAYSSVISSMRSSAIDFELAQRTSEGVCEASRRV